MRDDYSPRNTSALVWLLSATLAGFVLQMVFLNVFKTTAFDRVLELSASGLKTGMVWTLLTYGFLHSTTSFFHILFNCLMLFFLGRELLPLLGSRRFLGLYFGGIALGGVLWFATNVSYGGAVIGASAGVAALLVVFACIYPNQRMTFLLFFILPVTVKPKVIAWIALGIDLCGFLFYEISGRSSPFGFAHSAHLGGMAAGWLFFRYVYQREWRHADSRLQIELPRWLKRSKKPPLAAPTYKVNITQSREDLRAEVDRILDKINSEGFASLTPEEKRVLDDAKDSLSRR